MNDLQIEALYERALIGDPAAADALIAALTHSDPSVRNDTAYALIELMIGDALNAEQVARLYDALDRTLLDEQPFKWLLESVRRFQSRQPQPCPDCGRCDCWRTQLDADWWSACEPDPMANADAERY